MEPNQIALLVGIVAVLLAAAAWFYLQRQRSSKLRGRFGPEYEHLLKETGSQRRAEKLLEKRQRRVNRLAIHSLPERDREVFAERWRQTQARFVDDPRTALEDANDLLEEVMLGRGYPPTGFEQRAADMSVSHAHVIPDYRTAHEIVARQRRGDVSTEELRQALVLYRGLFKELLELNEPIVSEEKHESTVRR